MWILKKLRQVLSRISLLVSGVTLTGGEPMTDNRLRAGFGDAEIIEW